MQRNLICILTYRMLQRKIGESQGHSVAKLHSHSCETVHA